MASATLTQLLSHSAGLVRDGSDAGQWTDRQPFLDEAGVRADLADGLTIAANTRFKYSNHGFGLLGLAIAGITSEPHASLERWYGLGTMSGTLGATAGGAGGGWNWFGHTGGFQGTLTRTAVVPAHELSVSVLTNSADGLARAWVDGCLHILRAFERRRAPSRRTAAWGGRWWTLWGAIDLLLMGGDKVLVANPSLANPVLDATELAISPRTRAGLAHGHIALAGGYGSHGEPVRLLRDANGRAVELWLAGTRYQPQAKVARELVRKYG